MKNTIRVRRKAGAKSALPQAKTSLPKTVTLLFYSSQKDEVIASVDFPETVFKIIKRVAKKHGGSVAEFINQALSKKLGLLCKPGAISEMRGAR